MLRRGSHLLGIVLALAGCSGTLTGGGGGGDDDDGGDGDGGPGDGDGGGGGDPDAGFVEGVNPCPSADNPPGPVQEFTWPAPSNTSNAVDVGATLRFSWSGSNYVVQVADWDGTEIDPALGRRIESGAASDDGSFDWNVGGFPCGYRPGIYYFLDDDGTGVTAVSLTEPEFDQTHFDPKPCSTLDDPAVYGGRYAAYADRPGCTVYEVNNFQTETHFDWVDPTFVVNQGDLVLFRWTGYHNVVQVHDVEEDELVGPGGVYSGPKSNCVGGPNYLCANGPSSLGEHLIDTLDWRPGQLHLSDECAYNRPGCPSATGPESQTGVNQQFTVRSPVVEPAAGSCCAIDPSKGTACRVVDLWNDRDGHQFRYNLGINRGDLLRIRWSGELEVYQAEPEADSDDPSTTRLIGGLATPGPIECIPGPDYACVGGDAAAAQLILDIDQAIADGMVHVGETGETYFLFKALGDGRPGWSSADADVRLHLDRETAYSPNPACP